MEREKRQGPAFHAMESDQTSHTPISGTGKLHSDVMERQRRAIIAKHDTSGKMVAREAHALSRELFGHSRTM